MMFKYEKYCALALGGGVGSILDKLARLSLPKQDKLSRRSLPKQDKLARLSLRKQGKQKANTGRNQIQRKTKSKHTKKNKENC